MLNGSFLLLVQNFHGPKLPSHSKNWLGNGSIIDIPLNGSVLRWARLKSITWTFCTSLILFKQGNLTRVTHKFICTH